MHISVLSESEINTIPICQKKFPRNSFLKGFRIFFKFSSLLSFILLRITLWIALFAKVQDKVFWIQYQGVLMSCSFKELFVHVIFCKVSADCHQQRNMLQFLAVGKPIPYPNVSLTGDIYTMVDIQVKDNIPNLDVSFNFNNLIIRFILWFLLKASIQKCKPHVKAEIWTKFTVISTLIITSNDRSLGCLIIYTDIIHTATLFMDISPMFNTIKPIYLLGRHIWR